MSEPPSVNRRRSPARRSALLGACLLALPLPAHGYPLDGFESTGIGRLEAQRLVQEGVLPGKKRPPGELLPLDRVRLRLLDRPDLPLPPSDAKLTAALKRLVGPNLDDYGIALLDLSDPEQPRYAEWHGNQRQNPGSVGKILVALAVFQALADIYPDDVAARRRVLRETMITADVFSVYDHHTVRFWNPETRKLLRRPIQKGDRASLYTYLDWMMSPSSNSAAAMLQKQLILLNHFGRAYPVPAEEEARFFETTSKQQLGEIFAKAIQLPVTRNGLDLEQLRQGSFFTRQGKQRVPGTTSYATPRSLMEFLLKVEQGKLVDRFSSLEIKRLMYVTERRIRYASSGVLRDSAVYFKSGSLYSCMPEEGFVCRKYHGNRRNYMNSTAIVESPSGQDRLFYMVTVLSNVLRKNSALDHRDLARAIHGTLLRDHPEPPTAPGEVPAKLRYGEGFIGYEAERASLLLQVDTQEALTALGYEIGEIDGVIGTKTRTAIRRFQASHGLKVDSEPSPAVLERMRQVGLEKGTLRPVAP